VGVAGVLVVEDDEQIGRGLQTALTADGHRVAWCRTGSEGMRAATGSVIDLVLLDLGLPDIDGIEVCRCLRTARPALTIVMLTARTDEAQVVAGLDAGADDYLTKPFRLAELSARVRAHLRRPAALRVPGTPALVVGGLCIDPAIREARAGAVPLDLRAKEFDLLWLLADNAGRVLSRDSIMFAVWGPHHFGSTKTLDVHISALRRKLGPDPPVVITTMRGVGYRLDELP
jgi:DNA-binding response OmpR family regulator